MDSNCRPTPLLQGGFRAVTQSRRFQHVLFQTDGAILLRSVEVR